MTILAIFLVNAGLSFALSLVVAHLLGPEGFGRYAVALSAAVVINTVMFEWLRLSTTRFYSERTRREAPEIRATLNRGYLAMAVIVAALTALAWASGLRLGLTAGLLAATAAGGLTLGLFDYGTALARARFLNRTYAVMALVRGLGSFVFAAGAAHLADDPALVLAGSSLAALLALVAAKRSLSDPGPRPAGSRALIATFARYALPLVLASAVYQALPALNRALLADRAGFAEAGYFSLASEIGMRLFQNLGSALDLVLFQVAVRADELHGRERAQEQIRRNIGIVAAVLWPSAVGLWLVLPSFEAVFVPASFQGQFAPAMELLIPALAGFALVQYALNPVFQLSARTAPVIAAALVALALDLVLVLSLHDLASPRGFAAVQLAAMAGAALTLALVAAWGGARLPWRDLALGGLATAVMAAALWPLRALAPSLTTFALQVAAGVVVYGIAAGVLNVAGLRIRATERLANRQAAGG